MAIEIEQEKLQERTDNYWNNGNLVALQYEREDLVLSLNERVVQVRLEMLEDMFMEAGMKVADWAETGNMEKIDVEIKSLKKSDEYKTGHSKMGRLVEEILKK